MNDIINLQVYGRLMGDDLVSAEEVDSVLSSLLNEHDTKIQELQEELAEHKDCIDKNIIEHNKLYDKCAELIVELEHWISQYGCECGHNSCKKCKDTQDAKILLTPRTKGE